MALADFNKDNPFVIIMKERAEKLEKTSVTVIKNYLISVFLFTLLCILDIFTIKTYMMIVITVIFSIANGLMIIRTLQSSELKRVNDIIYGNEYSVISINNEKLLEIIEKLNYIQGKMDYIIGINITGISISVIMYMILFTESHLFG